MKNILLLTAVTAFALMFSACEKKEEIKNPETPVTELTKVIQERVDIYVPTVIKSDISHLSENQKKVISILIDAGKYADEIFWKQTSYDAIAIRDSLAKMTTPEAIAAYEFVKINYGPYDLIEEGKRYIGEGIEKKPATGAFYPEDMTKEEFNAYVAAHPEQKEDLESLYTIVRRDGDKLVTSPYHVEYPEQLEIALKLEEAAQFADNSSLKKYLLLRAEALRTDNYFDSDMAWMEIKDNDIDVVIGPIESYEDGLFNYRAAYEAVVFVRDLEATKELQMFKDHILEFESKLPYDKKYIRTTVDGSKHILNMVNVCYFGGDCQAGTKTIACNLPNDPKVRTAKGGGKNQMYMNLIRAKFNKIVVPIAETILDPSLLPFITEKAFTGFITLHEISHTLGSDYVFGKDKETVRKALKERYSAIEETKADILSMYNHGHLIEMGTYTKDYGKQAMATYIAGLYRSIRFGAEEAHGKANIIQLNFLREKGAVVLQEDGKFNINEDIFFASAGELAKIVLTIEAEGDYEAAGELLETYGHMTPEIKNTIAKLATVPRDLNTTYEIAK